jgi:hypothetical protein
MSLRYNGGMTVLSDNPIVSAAARGSESVSGQVVPDQILF